MIHSTPSTVPQALAITFHALGFAQMAKDVQSISPDNTQELTRYVKIILKMAPPKYLPSLTEKFKVLGFDV